MPHWGVDSHQLKRVNEKTGLSLLVEWPFFKHAVMCTFKEKTEERFSVRMTECLSARKFKDMDATDIGYSM